MTHPMIIYQIENFRNFDTFPNSQFFFEIEQFQKYDYSTMNMSIIET